MFMLGEDHILKVTGPCLAPLTECYHGERQVLTMQSPRPAPRVPPGKGWGGALESAFQNGIRVLPDGRFQYKSALLAPTGCFSPLFSGLKWKAGLEEKWRRKARLKANFKGAGGHSDHSPLFFSPTSQKSAQDPFF